MLRSKDLMYFVILGFFVYRERKVKYKWFRHSAEAIFFYLYVHI